MNLFVDALNAKNGLTHHNPLYTNNKEDKIHTHMFNCTYPDQTKFYIQKAVKQVFQVYPFFDFQILTFPENNVQKRYIQLKAILQIQVRGKLCKVDFNMMLPDGFPKKAPFVRIINHNTNFHVDSFYEGLKSTTDSKSYILNPKLNQIKNWQPSKSLVSIISEAQDIFRQHFPFIKQSDQNSSFQSGNSLQSKNSFQSGWSKPSPWQPINRQQQFSGNGFKNYQPNYQKNISSNGWGQKNMHSPPVSFGKSSYQENINQTIAKAQAYAGRNKKILEKMKIQHCKTVQKLQTMQILKYSMSSQQSFLTKQNYEISFFLRKNQVQSLQQLSSLVKPQDPLSDQILDIVSTIKASEDTVNLLDSKFSKQQVTLQEFLKNLRKIQEEKFETRALLSKCISKKSYR